MSNTDETAPLTAVDYYNSAWIFLDSIENVVHHHPHEYETIMHVLNLIFPNTFFSPNLQISDSLKEQYTVSFYQLLNDLACAIRRVLINTDLWYEEQVRIYRVTIQNHMIHHMYVIYCSRYADTITHARNTFRRD